MTTTSGENTIRLDFALKLNHEHAPNLQINSK